MKTVILVGRIGCGSSDLVALFDDHADGCPCRRSAAIASRTAMRWRPCGWVYWPADYRTPRYMPRRQRKP